MPAGAPLPTDATPYAVDHAGAYQSNILVTYTPCCSGTQQLEVQHPWHP